MLVLEGQAAMGAKPVRVVYAMVTSSPGLLLRIWLHGPTITGFYVDVHDL